MVCAALVVIVCIWSRANDWSDFNCACTLKTFQESANWILQHLKLYFIKVIFYFREYYLYFSIVNCILYFGKYEMYVFQKLSVKFLKLAPKYKKTQISIFVFIFFWIEVAIQLMYVYNNPSDTFWNANDRCEIQLTFSEIQMTLSEIQLNILKYKLHFLKYNWLFWNRIGKV